MNRLNVPLWAAGWIFVTTTALAQSAPPLVPAAAPLSANETPSRATAGADSCQVDPPRIVGQSMGKRLFALRLASDRDTALLTWSTEPNKVQVAALAPNGAVRAQVQSIPLAGARQFVALKRFDDQHFVLLTHHLCEPAIRDHKCLVGQFLDHSGAPAGPGARYDTNEWMTETQSELLDKGLYILYRTTYKGPSLVLLDRNEQGTARMQAVRNFRPCADETRSDPGNYGSLSLSSFGGKWNAPAPKSSVTACRTP